MTDEIILLSHGGGGQMMADLIDQVFLPAFDNPALNQKGDSAVVDLSGQRLAFTTDSFVVDPLFFPGGDIGRLAVCGTVNDLAAAGAKPLWLSASFILEEGLPQETLGQVCQSMSQTAEEAEVAIVTGDTKVVQRGSVDKMFITTSGVGMVAENTNISGSHVRPGDVVLINGAIGDHGMAIMSQREGLGFEGEIASDTAPLADLVAQVLSATDQVHALRDPTRGGLATALDELARQSGVCIEIEEESVPIHDPVRAACEMLGLDPFYVANEGKMIVVVAPEAAESALTAMKDHRYGSEAAIIGQVLPEPAGRVHLRTPWAGTRILDRYVGEQMPRIC